VRLSRWGRSAVETDVDRQQDADALGPLVDVVPDDCDAEILVVGSGTRVDHDLLERARATRLVITGTSGFDHLDLNELQRRGIAAARCPLARRDAVVETALGALLWGARRFDPLQRAAERGHWARNDLPAMAAPLLRGSRVGVVGLGVIGRQMAHALKALGAEVVGADPLGVPSDVVEAPLPVMFESCVAVSMHCELTARNHNMVDAALLQGAAPGLILVNTARGKLVDVPAAIAALDSGRLGALCLDVFPREPWPDLAALAARPACLVLPHAAGYHNGLAAAVRRELVDTVRAFVANQPLPHALPIA
jgi:D-3-phosphoglycerate dehydrogenase / 2-oxoglutarate reductase